MNFLLIPDKFKGSLTAKDVIASISKGILSADSTSKIQSIIASDGGDGFLDAISNNQTLQEINVDTVDPLMRSIIAPYLINRATNTAYVELAKASGLELLKDNERNVMKTTTYGTGVQIKDAIAKGATTIYLGLGGSATNDAGMGIAKALGYTFFDKNKKELEPIGRNLSQIFTIDKTNAFNAKQVSFYAVNDVDNPLFGTNGAAYVYGKQKGANEEVIKILDAGLFHLNELAVEQLNQKNAFVPGSGAAGGTAYGLKTFLRAEYINGVEFLLQLAEVSNLLETQKIDYIITGEGKIDSQTINGKLVKGVLELGQRYDIPVVAICGKLDIEKEELSQLGLEHVIQIYEPSKGMEYSMKNASKAIEDLIFDFFKNKWNTIV